MAVIRTYTWTCATEGCKEYGQPKVANYEDWMEGDLVPPPCIGGCGVPMPPPVIEEV